VRAGVLFLLLVLVGNMAVHDTRINFAAVTTGEYKWRCRR